MTCDRCNHHITGGYWVVPAEHGVQRVCRACCAPPRHPEPHEPTVEDTRRLYAQVRRMLNAPNN